MASSEVSQVCSLPLPPAQYINNYTDENIKRGRAPRPPPPIHDTYTMFGNTFNADDAIIRPLEAQNIKRLYPQHFDRRRELRKLNHSLLVNFLDLLDLLVRCPENPKRNEKVEDISLLFIHIHHLLNEFRPHQARETLRVMMDLQKRQRIEISQRFQKHLDKVIEMLQQAIQTLPDTSDFDSKLMVPTESFDSSGKNNKDLSAADASVVLDEMMCNIVDNLFKKARPSQIGRHSSVCTVNVNSSAMRSTSNATHLYLKKVLVGLSGRYSCEVSADAPSFRTALVSGDMNVVVIPRTLPEVQGVKPKYKVGDVLKATCISKDSRPAANLSWGLNGQTLDSEYFKQYAVIRAPDSNLETSMSTISLELQRHHFTPNGRIKIRCTASIHNVYWRTLERSAEEDKPRVVDAAQVRKPTELVYDTTPLPSAVSGRRHTLTPTILFLTFPLLFLGL